jgi:hypothetical protein
VRDLNFEQLFILAVLLLAGLVNLVLDWLRNRRRKAQPQHRDDDLAIAQEELDLAEPLWRERTAEVPPDLDPARVPVPPAPRVRSGQGATPPVVPRISPPRSPTRSPQGRRLHRRIDPREARRGVVLMTILGPCRGAEPPAGNASRRRPRRERVE